jgi:hypothetical protein
VSAILIDTDHCPAITFGGTGTINTLAEVLRWPCELRYTAEITTADSHKQDYELARATNDGLMVRGINPENLAGVGAPFRLDWDDILVVHLY